MLMEIYLSEEKAKKNNIDLNECYQKIDKYFKSRGVEIVSKGIYKGVRKDFDTFAIAQGSLPDTKWFLKVVDQWYISYFGNGPESPEYREDALRCYYEVEKRNNGFFRKQKGYISFPLTSNIMLIKIKMHRKIYEIYFVRTV